MVRKPGHSLLLFDSHFSPNPAMTFFIRHDRLIGSLGTVVVTLGFIFGIVRPQQLKATAIESEVTQLQEILSALPHQIAERDRVQEQLNHRQERTRRPHDLVSSHAAVAEVLQEVAELARQSEVVITRLESLPQEDFASYADHPFSLACKGEFGGLAKFLSGLETQPRLVAFTALRLARDAAPQDRQVLTNIRLSVYSRHSNSAPSTVNANSPVLPLSDN